MQIHRKETNQLWFDKKEKTSSCSANILVGIALLDIISLDLIPPRVCEASIISLQTNARERADPFRCTEYVNEIHAQDIKRVLDEHR